MAEYIEREKAIHAVEKKLNDARENCLFQVTNYLSVVKALLRVIPAAAVQPIVEGASHDGEQDVAPVVHGEWVEKPFLLGTSNFCSLCDSFYGMPHGKFNYCPNCGAKMDGAHHVE